MTPQPKKNNNTASGNLFSKSRCFLCRILCGDHFFNRDASLEIDRLTVENEQLRQGIAELEKALATAQAGSE